MKRFILLTLLLLQICCGSASASLYGTVFQFLLNPQQTVFTNLAGGTVYFYAAGSTTPQTIWLDRYKVTQAANPYTLDANGTAYLFGDGLYHIEIYDVNGVKQYDRDNLNFVDYVTSGSFQTQSSNYASLNAAITAIGSTPTTLTILSAGFPLTASAVVPSTLALNFLVPGSIAQGSYTLTANGPVTAPPGAQIFTGAGAVTINATNTPIQYAAWGGGITNTPITTANIASQTVAFATASHGSLIDYQILTTGTTYTPTTGTNTIVVELIGGGGGGGGATGSTGNAAIGAGGNSGAYAVKTFTGISGTYAYAIGSAGTGGSNSGGNGGQGGNTTFTGPGAVTVTAGGGYGGAGMTYGTTMLTAVPYSIAATSTNGDINIPGNFGLCGLRLSGTLIALGNGASSPAYGSGGWGANALGYGAGGSGNATTTSSSVTGYTGSPGIIIVWEYY